MSPVESMSCGKPVIWVKEWGLLETVIDGETWILIDPKAPVEEIRKAVETLSEDKCKEMESACIKRAEFFSMPKFTKDLNQIVDEMD